jgi:peptidoglycan/LPS O-acetylase OafA/YrhL
MTTPSPNPRDNNFDAIRLAAALAVIIGHSCPVVGYGDSPLVLGREIQGLGVNVFFSISGYLVAKSWLRQANLARFFRNRVLRIFPALIVVTLISVFVLGPLLTTLPLGAYFANPETWRYLLNCILVPTYPLPGVFEANHYPSAVNGSLWTLPIEFACYIATPIVLSIPRLRRAGAVAFFAVSVAAGLFGGSVALGAHSDGLAIVGSQTVFFAGGMIIATTLDTHKPRLDVAGFALVTLVTVQSLFASTPAVGTVAAWVVVPYVSLALGLACTPIVHRAGRFGDMSYGVYILAWPVQQVIAQFWPQPPFWANFALVTAVTLILAYCSWHLVEKRALALKS